MAFLLLTKYIVSILFLSNLNGFCHSIYHLTFSLIFAQGKKYPKFFWVSAIAPLTSVIIATFCVGITRADKEGVQIVSAHNFMIH